MEIMGSRRHAALRWAETPMAAKSDSLVAIRGVTSSGLSLSAGISGHLNRFWIAERDREMLPSVW